MKTRIAKYIADCGAASRRRAEELIAAGAVAVNGEKILSPVFFVDENDKITINGALVSARDKTKLFAFHKPVNVMTTVYDPDGRKTIYDCLDGKYKNLKYVGRLDFKTSGLLLMTNDGALARKLTLPQSRIPRTYLATVVCNDLSGLDRARHGITVDGIKYQPMKINIVSSDCAGAVLNVEITEGKKNEVRIVLRACGCPVRKLHRVSFGPIKLGNLAVGKIQPVSQKTIDALTKSL